MKAIKHPLQVRAHLNAPKNQRDLDRSRPSIRHLSLKLSYSKKGATQEREVYPLIARIVSKRVQRGREPGSIDFEDAMSAVVVSCLSDARLFQPDRNVHIHTFLYPGMQGTLTRLLKNELQYASRFSPTDFVTGSTVGYVGFLDRIKQPCDVESSVHNRLLASKVLDVLSRRADPRGAYSLVAFVVDGLEDAKIAANLGTTVWHARRMRKEAIEVVRETLPKSAGMLWG